MVLRVGWWASQCEYQSQCLRGVLPPEVLAANSEVIQIEINGPTRDGFPTTLDEPREPVPLTGRFPLVMRVNSLPVPGVLDSWRRSRDLPNVHPGPVDLPFVRRTGYRTSPLAAMPRSPVSGGWPRLGPPSPSSVIP